MTTLSPSQLPKQSNIPKALLDLQRGNYTGSVKFSCKCVKGTTLQYFCFWEDGCLTLANPYLITVKDIINLLAKELKLGYIDSLLSYISRRVDLETASGYEVLSTIVATKAVSWENIEKLCLQRVILTLERLMPYTCSLDPDETLRLGIAFGEDRHAFNCADILQQLAQRQKRWKQYAPIIQSLEDVPIVHEGALANVSHKPTLTHLEKCVDGNRGIAEIAESIDQDPLALAGLYYRWVQEGLIEIIPASTISKAQAKPVILSVDDSPIVQSMIRKSISTEYEVLCAGSAMEALGILNKSQVDLILLDVTMPEIDGFEFCRTIRKISKFKDIPVIMLTAKDGFIDRAMGHLAGTNRYLTKPVDKDELLKAIKEYV